LEQGKILELISYSSKFESLKEVKKLLKITKKKKPFEEVEVIKEDQEKRYS
jgi:hypothetical protein